MKRALILLLLLAGLSLLPTPAMALSCCPSRLCSVMRSSSGNSGRQ